VKRRKNPWPAVLLALLVVAATIFILLRFVFVVRSVQVEGDVNMSSEDVIRSGDIGFGESIFRVNEDEIRRAINASGQICFEGVEADYPDTLILHVHQREPVTMIMHAGKILVLDESGCAMRSIDEAPDTDLIFVTDFGVSSFRIGEVVSADEDQLADYCAVVQAIVRSGAAGLVSELNLADGQNLWIITRRGIEVRLGDRRSIDDKIAWMKSAVVDLENRGQYGGVLDVSSGTKADYRAS